MSNNVFLPNPPRNGGERPSLEKALRAAIQRRTQGCTCSGADGIDGLRGQLDMSTPDPDHVATEKQRNREAGRVTEGNSECKIELLLETFLCMASKVQTPCVD